MTDTTCLPPGRDAEDWGQRMREHVVNSVPAEAGEAGRRAAEWVGELAGRQTDWGRHRIVLERAAATFERTSGRGVVPGGHGELAEELAHDLAANVITGSVSAPGLPQLAVGERVALVAVCALAAAMPAAVLGDVDYKIPPLASTMDAAVAPGRAAGPGTGGHWPHSCAHCWATSPDRAARAWSPTWNCRSRQPAGPGWCPSSTASPPPQ